MRLTQVEHGHAADAAAEIEAALARGEFVSDIRRTLVYRPELFGRPFSELMQDVMRGPSDWSAGERELIAAWVSRQNQCPF